MRKENTHRSKVLLTKNKSKDKHYQTQMQVVFDALFKQPKTMLMVRVETGIERANICRYVGVWKRQNNIKIVRLGICPLSKYNGVQFLTTNPELFPIDIQLNLFNPKI